MGCGWGTVVVSLHLVFLCTSFLLACEVDGTGNEEEEDVNATVELEEGKSWLALPCL